MNNEPLFFKTLLLKGEPGGTIERIVKTGSVDDVDTYTIYINDGTTQEFTVKNGTSIDNISYTSSSGNVDTYTVTLTDGSTTTFNVTNGEDYTVPTDGVIYFDGTTVPDGYEETNPPSGSGQYAVIDDANASLQTTYSSSKIEQLISGIGGGGIDYSTTEQDTGLKWIDGKPIYQKTIVYTNTSVSLVDLNIDEIVDIKGVSYLTDGTVFLLNTYAGIQYNINMDITNDILTITFNGWAFSKANITILYTKTTDTV